MIRLDVMVRMTERTALSRSVLPSDFTAKKASKFLRGTTNMKQASKAFSLGLVALVCFFFANGFANADTIYVGDGGQGTIMKYDSSGNGSVFATLGAGDPLWTMTLTLDSSGNLYVPNYRNNDTIMKYDSSGNGSVFVSGLSLPSGLAFDSSGNLYVGSHNNTITKYDSSGNESDFTSWGLNRPWGLAFDSSNNLYAVNNWGHTITKYDSSGSGSIFATWGLGKGSVIRGD